MRLALLAILAAARIAAAPVYYKADVLLTSAYRVLEWSRTPALFIHDAKRHEYRTPRALAIQGKEHVLVDGIRVMFPGKPDHLDERMQMPSWSIASAARGRTSISRCWLGRTGR